MKFSLNLPFTKIVFLEASRKHKTFFKELFFSLKNDAKNLKYRVIVNFSKVSVPKSDLRYLEENTVASKGTLFIYDTKGNILKINPKNFKDNLIDLYVDYDFDLYYLYNYVIEPLVVIWGAKHRLLYVHSSVLAKNNKAYVLAAWRHTGKTSTIFNLAGENVKFMGDDFSVVYNSKVYLYQKSLNIFSYNFETYPWLYKRLNRTVSIRIKSSVYLKKLLYFLSQKLSDPLSKVFFRLSELAEISTNTKITPTKLGFGVQNEAVLEKVIFLTKSDRSKSFSRNLKTSEIQEKLLAITIYEIGDFLNIYLKYKYLYPTNSVDNIDKFEQNYREAVRLNIKSAEDVGIKSFKGQDSYLTNSFLNPTE